MIFKLTISQKHTMMDPEVKQRWIEALNSDEYNQTQGCLRDNTGFCCLGVITDLYVKEHNQEWNLDDEGEYSFGGWSATLSGEVINWAGLETNDPGFLNSSNGRVYLSDLNDNGFSFKQITQIIEENF